jgi:GNAT superfamily N-acetyltransferase
MNQLDSSTAPQTDVEIDLLTPGTAADFAHLTANALRPLLFAPDIEAERLGLCLLAATREGRPVGLIVSVRQRDDQELCSLMVDPSCRRAGIGKAMIFAWVARMRALGRAGVATRWSSALPKAEAFFRLLQSCDWPMPTPTRHRMTWRVGDCATGFPKREALLKRLEGNGLRIRSFAEMAEDLERIVVPASRALIERDLAPAWSAPGGWFASADHDTSVVLVHADHGVVGWMVCVPQPEFGRWYIPLGWVVKEGIPRGWLLGGFASVFQRTERLHGPEARIIAQPPAHVEGGMGQLLFKHFSRFAVAADYLLEGRMKF